MSSDDDESREVIPRTNPEWTNPSIRTYPSRVVPANENVMRKRNLARIFQRTGPSSSLKTMEDFRLMKNFNVNSPFRQNMSNNREFQLEFDVRQLKPEEIHVKSIGNQQEKQKNKTNDMVKNFQRDGTISLPNSVNDTRLMDNFSVNSPFQQNVSENRKFQLEFDTHRFNPNRIHTESFGNQLFAQSMQQGQNKMNDMATDFQRAGTSSRLGTVEDFPLTDDLKDFNPVQEDSYGNKRFQQVFDTRRCKPDDIIIITSGNMLVVYCKYEEKENEISVSREYSGQIMLPEEVNTELLMSTISADGTLKISAPL